MKLYTFLLFILFSVSIVYGQETDATVVGHVKCGDEHIPYASVFIKGTSIGVATDATGHYMINDVPAGTHTLKVQVVGYKSKERQITIKDKQYLKIDFEVEKDVFLTEQVVVTASRNEVNRKEAPVVVNILSPKVFETTQAVCLADGLDFTPGLRTENNCQNCGFSQLRMNGLEGPYSQILINSRPIFSGLAGVYGLELLPASMIQRVEVVRGGGSAIFGGNAIAGTVNIITKDPLYNTFVLQATTNTIGVGDSKGGKIAIDNNISFNGSVVSDDNNSGLFIYGLTRNKDPYDENNDGFSESVLIKNTTVGLNAFHKLNSISKISMDFYRINEFRRGGNKFNMLAHEADIAEQLQHYITGVGAAWETYTSDKRENKFSVFSSMQNVNRESYYGAQQDPNAYGLSEDLTYTIGSQFSGQLEKALFAKSNFVTGVEFVSGNLIDTKMGAGGNPNTTIVDQSTHTIGGFLQNEWDLSFMKLLVGFRNDYYTIIDNNTETGNEISGNVVCPRVNFLFDIKDNIQYRLAYSSGYRAPQIFDEDMHIEASGARRVTHTNSPDLIQENSYSVTSSINYSKMIGNIQSEMLIEGFYTILDNPFSNEFSHPDEFGNIVYTRMNAEDGAYVTGINMELNLAFSKKITTQIGFTLQESKYLSGQQWGEEVQSVTNDFLRTPSDYGFITFNYDINKKLEIGITGTYTGKMTIPHFGLDPETTDPDEQQAIANGDVITGERLEESNIFFDLGFNIAYDLELSNEVALQFKAGVRNIMNHKQGLYDRGVFRDAGYIYGPGQPRTLFFGVKMGIF